MKYWLMKSEPDAFSIDDLINMPNQTEHWDGIRNYQARNFMRDDMKIGDLIFFYHSNTDPIGIVGVMEVVREAYPDHTQFDKDSKYYDPKSNPDEPRWMMVDVKFKTKYNGVVTPAMLKEIPELANMLVIKRGQRLSIQPVTKTEFEIVDKLGKSL